MLGLRLLLVPPQICLWHKWYTTEEDKSIGGTLGNGDVLPVVNTTVLARAELGEARRRPLVNPEVRLRYYYRGIKEREEKKDYVNMNASPFLLLGSMQSSQLLFYSRLVRILS